MQLLLARGAAGGATASAPRASPYRVPPVDAGESGAPPAQGDVSTLAVLLFVLGCSLLRLVLFAVGPERFGVDPALALAASAASAYHVSRLLAH